MSEYWKSTPKYWCKHCSTFVKDTPFERRQHENTGKHQGNLKRFLRGIQNDHERNEREKQKVKDEVQRLNRVVGSNSDTGSGPASNTVVTQPAVRKSHDTNLTAVDQKRQWAQLADMGIQIPEGVRAEFAMAGEWQTTNETPTYPSSSEVTINTGVRKRGIEDVEGAEESGEAIARQGWGSTTKRYPKQSEEDLESLLSNRLPKKEMVSKSELTGNHDDVGSMPTNEQPVVAHRNEDHDAHASIDVPKKLTGQKSNDDLDTIDSIKHEGADDFEPASTSKVPNTTAIPLFKKRRTKIK